jgi:hypothetical protein
MNAPRSGLAVKAIAYNEKRKAGYMSGRCAAGATVTVSVDDTDVNPSTRTRDAHWCCTLHKYNGHRLNTFTVRDNSDGRLTVRHKLDIDRVEEGGLSVDDFTYDPDAGIAYASGTCAAGATVTVFVDRREAESTDVTGDGNWSCSFNLDGGSHNIRVETNTGKGVDIGDTYEEEDR